MSEVGPGCVKTRTFMVCMRTSWPARPALGADRFYQTTNAQNAHHPFHVVGQDVQGHFGADVLERFHLEVCRSHPRLYRAEVMLHSLAAQAHFIQVPCEARLHGLKDGFMLPTRDSALFARRALALQRAGLAGGGPIAMQCLAVLFIGVAMG